MFKKIDIHFQNIYLEDNTGILFDHISNKQGLGFSYDKEFTKNQPKSSGEFCNFNIRLEKVKEKKIYRNYLNLAQVIANIGGVLKILTLFSSLLPT